MDFTEDLVGLRKNISYITQQKLPRYPSWDASALEHRDCVSIFPPSSTPLDYSISSKCAGNCDGQTSVCTSGLEVLKSDVIQDQGDPGGC